MAKFEIYQTKNGYRWRLKASNGEVVTTGEEYTTKECARQGAAAVARASATGQKNNPITLSEETLSTYRGDFERLAKR